MKANVYREIDESIKPRPRVDIEAALACITREVMTNPMARAKNDEMLVIHYIVIRDALRELLSLRSTEVP